MIVRRGRWRRAFVNRSCERGMRGIGSNETALHVTSAVFHDDAYPGPCGIVVRMTRRVRPPR